MQEVVADQLGLQERPMDPLVSVLVRVKNEIAALPAFWKALSGQSIFDRIEVIFLDSGSTDGTLEYLRTLPCRLYQLNAEFNFGRSCNQIAELSSGKILMFLSGHVLFTATDTVEKVYHLLGEAPAGAAYLRQVPNTQLGYSSYDAAYLARRYPAGTSPILQEAPNGFSNSASALTREAWLRCSFPELHGSEDYRWALLHLAAGGQLYYCADQAVMHSHAELPAQVHARVNLNARARGIRHRYDKVLFYFLGVYLMMVRHGARPTEALSYAWAHASAYL